MRRRDGLCHARLHDLSQPGALYTNPGGVSCCGACKTARDAARRREAGIPLRSAQCRNGHDLTALGRTTEGGGGARCVVCRQASLKRRWVPNELRRYPRRDGLCCNGHDLAVLGRSTRGVCRACHRAANVRNRHHESEAALTRRKAHRAVYRASPAGRAADARENASLNGMLRRWRYEDRGAHKTARVLELERELQYGT